MRLIKRISSWFSESRDSEKYSVLGALATKRKRVDNNPMGIVNNPNTNSKLANSIEDYKDYLLDAHIASCVQSRKSGVLSMEWEIESGDTQTEQGAFIEQVFNNLDIYGIMNEMLDAVLFGYKPMEIIWDVDSNNRLVISDIKGKPQWWFRYINNSFKFITHNNSISGIALPPYKFVILQNQPTYLNPYGDAILARCHFPLLFKKAGMELWGQFTEKYGMPFLHGVVEGGKDDELDAMSSMLYQLQQDGAVATSERATINSINTNTGDSPDNYQKFIHFCNAEISKGILSQTLTTEQGDTGSYAMSQTHLQVRKDVVQFDARLVESALNQIIYFLIDLNFSGSVEYPKFGLYGDVEADIQLATRDQLIFSGNYCKPTKEYLMRHHNFKEDEIEMIEMIEAPVQAPAFSENNKEISALPTFDELAQNIIQPVLDLVENGGSFEEIETALIEHFPEMNYKDIEEYLAKAFLVAQASGLIGKE